MDATVLSILSLQNGTVNGVKGMANHLFASQTPGLIYAKSEPAPDMSEHLSPCGVLDPLHPR
jgi:hypothetical protein